MIHHIVTWCFKEEVPSKEKAKIADNMKVELEGLVGKVPGLLKAKVEFPLMDSSTHDIALFTILDTKENLLAYQSHKEHCHVADHFVRPYVCNRTCIDYEG